MLREGDNLTVLQVEDGLALLGTDSGEKYELHIDECAAIGLQALIDACEAVGSHADDTGCDGDLTVTSKSAVEKMLDEAAAAKQHLH